MTHGGLQRHVEELCDVLHQLSRPAADGPCWCDRVPRDEHGAGHTPKCSRARAALLVGQAAGIGADDAAPGYGFGV